MKIATIPVQFLKNPVTGRDSGFFSNIYFPPRIKT